MNPALDQFAETAATLEKDARETADMAPDPARRPAAPELEVIVVRVPLVRRSLSSPAGNISSGSSISVLHSLASRSRPHETHSLLTWMHRSGRCDGRVVTAKCPVVVKELNFSQKQFG
ncbi:hypothetical protein, partial [Rhodococcus pyridinivorans]|uniref:hypothetical protein n=1 Tax=Rhodococcus pyridinivorans TaxID=103816 RepID=UPI002657BFB4